MASKNNQQRNDEDKGINRAGTKLSDSGTKEFLNNSSFQRKQLDNNTPSSSLRSSKENKQNKLSESSNTRSNSSDQKNKSSPSKTDRSNSVNRASSRQSTRSTKAMNKGLQSSSKSQRKQLDNNTPSSSLRSSKENKQNKLSESSNKAPKKKSGVQKVFSNFVNAVKHPTRTIKSSLGMKNDKKTKSHVDKLNNERSNAGNRKTTRSL